jgi:ferredoxin-NADP reductase
MKQTNPKLPWPVVALLLLGLTRPVAAQVTPEEHASHHPGAAGDSPAADDQATPGPEMAGKGMGGKGMGGGGGMGGGMGDKGGKGGMMSSMGGPAPKELYPTLIELPDLPLEKRAEVRAQAHQRMTEGAALLGSAVQRLSEAAPGNDFKAMQAALVEMREGLTRMESGVAAHRALEEGSAPRNVALQWFKREMNLLPPAQGAGSNRLFGFSGFHFFTMFVLVAFAGVMIWMYFHKMRRAKDLLQALTAPAPQAAAVTVAAAPVPAPAAAPKAPDTAKVAPAPAPTAEDAPAAPAASGGQGVKRAPAGERWTGDMRVCRVFEETRDIKTFRLVAGDGDPIPFTYLPGQFLTLTVEPEGSPVKRSYTIASSPTVQDYLEITVKRETQGLVSRYLHDTLKEGDPLKVKGPGGRLTFTGEGAEGIVLIGGGVGITPMMSVIRYLTDRGWPGAIYFLYSCKTTKDFVFREELEYLQRRHPNLNVMATMTREKGTVWMGLKGRLTRDLIGSAVEEITKPPIHICGPPPMMDAMKAMLDELGVPKEHVRTEAFGPPKKGGAAKPKAKPKAKAKTKAAPAKADPGEAAASAPAPAGGAATATFKASEKSGPLGPDETVLDVADALGVDIENSCRAGSCGSCTVRLLEGQVTMEVEDGLDSDQKAEGFILACQAMSESAVVIDA